MAILLNIFIIFSYTTENPDKDVSSAFFLYTLIEYEYIERKILKRFTETLFETLGWLLCIFIVFGNFLSVLELFSKHITHSKVIENSIICNIEKKL